MGADDHVDRNTPANDVYRGGDAAAVAKAVAMVESHIASHPDLMAIDPKDRQASH